MKITMIAPLLCLASLPVLSAGAENSVVATLSLPHATVLPGVPFEIDVELENVSSGTARVGLVARLVVTLADGTEIRPSGLAVLGPNSGSTFDASIELAPGQTIQRWISWSRFIMPEWSMDPRHAGPGTYEIALELSSDDPTGNDSSLRTSSVRLARAFDGPEDEVVWARMQEAGGEAWPDSGFISSHAGREIAEEILASHPSSSYYPYALVLNPIMKRPPIEASLETAERFPDSPANAHLLVQAAETAFGLAGKAHQRGDRPVAAGLYAQAAALYGRAATAKSLAIRVDAEARRLSAADAAKGPSPYRERE